MGVLPVKIATLATKSAFNCLCPDNNLQSWL
nr:MAG TPA: hypothetical protein [Caudoviricetes sp.]